MSGEVVFVETPSFYVKFEKDITRIKICQGSSLSIDYYWEGYVKGYGIIPVISFRRAFAEMGKTGICGEDAMFEVPWTAAQALRQTIEIFNKCSNEEAILLMRESELLDHIRLKAWEKLLDMLSVLLLAKKLQ